MDISDVKMEDNQQDVEDEEGPPPGFIPPSQAQAMPPASSVSSDTKMGSEQQDAKDMEEGPPPGWHSMPSSQLQTPVQKPPPPVDSSEKGQMVCGSCRQLLSYPRGAKYVKCACCQTVNYVLEEHQVGQVKCGGCAVLLMYPYGAPKVKCSSCRAVTEIGAHNRRPPLSEQQRRAGRCKSRVR